MDCNFMGNYMTREVLSKPVTTQRIVISLKATLKSLPMVTGVCLITSLFHKPLFFLFLYTLTKPPFCPVVQGRLELGLVAAEWVLSARCTQLHIQSHSQHIKITTVSHPTALANVLYLNRLVDWFFSCLGCLALTRQWGCTLKKN